MAKQIIYFSFLFLIFEFAILFSIFFLPTFASSTTIDEMHDLGARLQTPWSIHNHNLRETNYSVGYFPRDIDVYWENKIGDCSEIARADYYMLQGAGIDAQVRTGWLNGVKHAYIQINGTPAFDKQVVTWKDHILKSVKYINESNFQIDKRSNDQISEVK